MADSSTQMVEVAPKMTYRIHKLLSFKLSVSSEVTLEHDAGEVINHFSSNLFSSAFFERCNIAFDTSLATGEPFWNICIRLFENSVIT